MRVRGPSPVVVRAVVEKRHDLDSCNESNAKGGPTANPLYRSSLPSTGPTEGSCGRCQNRSALETEASFGFL